MKKQQDEENDEQRNIVIRRNNLKHIPCGSDIFRYRLEKVTGAVCACDQLAERQQKDNPRNGG